MNALRLLSFAAVATTATLIGAPSVAAPVPSTMPCCLSAPHVLPDGAFKYVGIPYRFAYPVRPIPGFAPTGPSAPIQPETHPALAPIAPASATGPSADLAVSSPPAPGAPSHR